MRDNDVDAGHDHDHAEEDVQRHGLTEAEDAADDADDVDAADGLRGQVLIIGFGRFAQVGANSVLLSDAPECAVMFGVPARKVAVREPIIPGSFERLA